MTKFILNTHPCPMAPYADDKSTKELVFNSKAEKENYIAFEQPRTSAEFRAFGAASTINERKLAAEALSKKRQTVFKAWKNRNKPIPKGVA